MAIKLLQLKVINRFNNNIRCIEIKTQSHNHYQHLKFNNNIRCIEMITG